jgi:hypothetical protein
LGNFNLGRTLAKAGATELGGQMLSAERHAGLARAPPKKSAPTQKEMVEQLNAVLGSLLAGQQKMEARLNQLETGSTSTWPASATVSKGTMRGPGGAGGTALFGPADPGTATAAAAKGTVLGMVGGPPTIRTGEMAGLASGVPRLSPQRVETQTSLADAGSLNVEQLVAMVAAATATLCEEGAGSLLGEASDRDSGARGAAAYAAQKKRFEAAPDRAWEDAKMKARELLARREGEPTRWAALVSELPWGSFNTAKRSFAAVAAIADAMESGDMSLCRGRIAQTLRWLALSIDCPKDHLFAWRLTFLADPVPVVTPTRVGTGGFDLNASMLDQGRERRPRAVQRSRNTPGEPRQRPRKPARGSRSRCFEKAGARGPFYSWGVRRAAGA